MHIGVPSETVSDETRVSLIPPIAADLVEAGHAVTVERGAGEEAEWTDEQYREAGCTVTDRAEVFEAADLVAQVRGLGAAGADGAAEYTQGQTVIGMLGPYGTDEETLAALADREVNALAFELMPRISRAQPMDAVSAMDSLSGYRAVTLAAAQLPKLFPMEMTAAGTVQPAEVFVLGAGVAGLKAIATAERLGASSRANDVRPEVREEVESLGAEFVEVGDESADFSDDEGYATEQDKSFEQRQKETLMGTVPDADVLVTTAEIPGRAAPQPITAEMIERMAPGSVVVDIAAGSGGNCELSRADEVVTHDGVEIHGPTNLPATIPRTASQLYANTVHSFVEFLLEDGQLEFDTDDEIVDGTLLTHDGTVRAPHMED